MFNRHQHQWGELTARVQSCVTCGKIRVIECPHKWEVIKEVTVTYKFGGGECHIAIQRCSGCGELKQFKVG